MKTNSLYYCSFGSFDFPFLEKSWIWLNDPQIKSLIMSPVITRESQRQWFDSLPNRADYKIWGISYEEVLIGACGLKRITYNEAEYWGYIGEKEYWGKGIGHQMIDYCVDEARKLGLSSLYLHVSSENKRALNLYQSMKFIKVDQIRDVFKMIRVL